jgi:AGCS family alanine or glycine:cation symporter
MILGMAFPNLAGVLLLSGKVKADLDHYLARLRSGAMVRSAALPAAPAVAVRAER